MDEDLDYDETLAGSPQNEKEALMEADEDYLNEEDEHDGCRDNLLGEGGVEDQEESRTKSIDSNDGVGGGDETSKLLNNSSGGGGGGDTLGRRESGGRAGSSSSISGAGQHQEPKSPREPFSYAYHFKKKYTFRSDSVYSDVTPMSSAPQNTAVSPKAETTRDKSGSLSSLKGSGSQSKWVSLKKKLGKIKNNPDKNKQSSSSSTTTSSQDEPPSALQQQAANVAAAAAERDRVAEAGGSSKSGKPIKSLQDRRSLLQRAKTLSILPVNSAPKNKEAKPRQEKTVSQPPELFNVGGEMNLIPLEMLININDIRRPQ